jgi:crotonobetainyl-CoA:carnitine CoA-transferase CaiB-like acyl-CoA transferase
VSSHAILSGVVVLERTDRPCVSFCGSLLGGLGATVLQVAGAEHDIDLTDAARAKAKQVTAAGKTLVTGVSASASWRRLAERADIVLLGYQGPQDRDLGADDSGRRIVCAFSAFGADAPAQTHHAGETALQALGGMMASTGAQGGAPERANVPIVEMFTALNAATAVLAALRNGKPAFLDIAAFDSAVAMLATFVSTVAVGRGDGYRIGCGHHLCSPWNVYRAADGWIQLCSTTDEHWQSVARLLARNDLGDDPHFAKMEDRLKNANTVDQVIGGWIAGRSMDEVARSFLSGGLPAGRVRTVPQVVRDSDLRARGMVVEADSPAPQVGSFLSASLGGARVAQSPGKTSDVGAVLATLGPGPTQSEGAASTSGMPLKGIRVVEIGAYTAGPLAGRYLADLGAEVIKVESAGGEVSRAWLPQFNGHSGYFVNCNFGKASVVLDLKNAADHLRFVTLVGTADVLLENLRPGALDNLGLGPDKLLGECPGLIYCSVSGFGRVVGSRPALDSVVQAEAGLMGLVGQGDRPQRVGISIADQAAAHAAPLLILAALRCRAKSGAGEHIDLSMQDALAWVTGLAWPDGKSALAPWATLQAADGWVMKRGNPLSEHAVAQLKTLTRDAAVAHLRQTGVGAVGVLEMGEVFAHEAIRRRNLVQFVETGGGAKVPVLSSPYRIGLPAGPERLPGPPGADAARIFGRFATG